MDIKIKTIKSKIKRSSIEETIITIDDKTTTAAINICKNVLSGDTLNKIIKILKMLLEI